MTHKVGLSIAGANFEAVGAVETFGTNFLALLTHEAWLAHADAVGLATPSVVDTFALVLTVVSPG
jgi:hypothetical protein